MAAMAESTEPESDEEIQRILDERHSKNTTKATKNALKTFSETVGDVQSLTSKEIIIQPQCPCSAIFSVAYFSV